MPGNSRSHGIASVARPKLWTSDGHVVYSDEPRLIGHQFVLEDDQIRAFATGQVVALPTDLDRPENGPVLQYLYVE